MILCRPLLANASPLFPRLKRPCLFDKSLGRYCVPRSSLLLLLTVFLHTGPELCATSKHFCPTDLLCGISLFPGFVQCPFLRHQNFMKLRLLTTLKILTWGNSNRKPALCNITAIVLSSQRLSINLSYVAVFMLNHVNCLKISEASDSIPVSNRYYKLFKYYYTLWMQKLVLEGQYEPTASKYKKKLLLFGQPHGFLYKFNFQVRITTKYKTHPILTATKHLSVHNILSPRCK